MLKKILIGVGAVMLVVIGALGMFLVTNHAHKKEVETLTAQISTLNGRLDAIGPMVTCYTVKAEVKPGIQLTQEMLQPMDVPQSCTNDDFCLNIDDIIGAAIYTDEDGKTLPAQGYYTKTTIHEGTPITKSLLMAEPLKNSSREIDINVTHWPVGLTVGDYVDIRIAYPRGEEFLVLTHKRVNEINNQTLKVTMDENEMAVWNSALAEFYIYGVSGSGKGMDLYATKYIEPGVQNPSVPFYSPSKNIMNVVAVNPNIEGIQGAAGPEDMHYSEAMRNLQEACLFPEGYIDDATGHNIFYVPISNWPSLLNSGRVNLIGLINADYDEWKSTHDYTGQPDIEGTEEEQQSGGSLITSGGVN